MSILFTGGGPGTFKNPFGHFGGRRNQGNEWVCLSHTENFPFHKESWGQLTLKLHLTSARCPSVSPFHHLPTLCSAQASFPSCPHPITTRPGIGPLTKGDQLSSRPTSRMLPFPPAVVLSLICCRKATVQISDHSGP